MATEPLSTRIPTELMAQVRAEIENSQTTLTATVTRLLTAGLVAEAASTMLGSRLAAADAEIARLKTAISLSSSTLPVVAKADSTLSIVARDDRFDDIQFGGREAGRYANIHAVIAERQRWVLRGTAVGAALLMIALVPMPYDWWFPQLIAKASMGGRGIDTGARLVGYDNGVQMLDRVCPMFEKAVAEYEAKVGKAKAENKRSSRKSDAAKHKHGRRASKSDR